ASGTTLRSASETASGTTLRSASEAASGTTLRSASETASRAVVAAAGPALRATARGTLVAGRAAARPLVAVPRRTGLVPAEGAEGIFPRAAAGAFVSAGCGTHRRPARLAGRGLFLPRLADEALDHHLAALG